MNCRTLAAAALLALASSLSAQTAGSPPQTSPSATPPPAATTPTKRQAPKPAAEEAPGGGPDKVWVNTNSSVYHCPGDRFYGKTAHGRYMTEAAAKAAGAHGVGGKTCTTGK
jgi:hypothetical protein